MRLRGWVGGGYGEGEFDVGGIFSDLVAGVYYILRKDDHGRCVRGHHARCCYWYTLSRFFILYEHLQRCILWWLRRCIVWCKYGWKILLGFGVGLSWQEKHMYRHSIRPVH